MKEEHHESKKMLLSLLVGGIVGAGVIYCIHSTQSRKTPVLKKIGKTFSEVGEMLESCSQDSSHAIEYIEEKLPRGMDVVNSLSDWVDTGLTLWKKFKKG